MIWWPFNVQTQLKKLGIEVVTHQWSGDPSIKIDKIITFTIICRNSPMIWWPFNIVSLGETLTEYVVTHQWSGDPSIYPYVN